METHKLDTEKQIFFYEQDFYVLSNFSSFKVIWRGIEFDTSEHAYHYAKFIQSSGLPFGPGCKIAGEAILKSKSAHEAFKIAERNKVYRDCNWNNVKESVMKEILFAKVAQHEYVYKKLMETGDRELIEDSWRDSYWGWGPNKDGQNMLGKLWMEIREELRNS